MLNGEKEQQEEAANEKKKVQLRKTEKATAKEDGKGTYDQDKAKDFSTLEDWELPDFYNHDDGYRTIKKDEHQGMAWIYETKPLSFKGWDITVATTRASFPCGFPHWLWEFWFICRW